MKYCLSANCAPTYLKQANEIRITGTHNVTDRVLNIMESYPDCEHIIFTSASCPVDTEMRRLMYLTKGKAIFAFNLWPIEEVEPNIPWFCTQVINSFTDLKAIAEAYTPAYIYIGSDLMHDLDAVASYGIPIRFNEFFACNEYRTLLEKHPVSIIGSYIRPEDIEVYSKYISVMEFSGSTEREEGMFRIYQDQKWSGKLKTLFPLIDTEALNRLIPPEFGERRMNCHTVCAKGGLCRYCYNILNYFAIKENIEKAKEIIDANE